MPGLSGQFLGQSHFDQAAKPDCECLVCLVNFLGQSHFDQAAKPDCERLVYLVNFWVRAIRSGGGVALLSA